MKALVNGGRSKAVTLWPAKGIFLPLTNDVLVHFRAEKTSCSVSIFPDISFSLQP
jgi:hypothetical protein